MWRLFPRKNDSSSTFSKSALHLLLIYWNREGIQASNRRVSHFLEGKEVTRSVGKWKSRDEESQGPKETSPLPVCFCKKRKKHMSLERLYTAPIPFHQCKYSNIAHDKPANTIQTPSSTPSPEHTLFYTTTHTLFKNATNHEPINAKSAGWMDSNE